MLSTGEPVTTLLPAPSAAYSTESTPCAWALRALARSGQLTEYPGNGQWELDSTPTAPEEPEKVPLWI